jgi:DNA-binding MarR family transcriptional regulator
LCNQLRKQLLLYFLNMDLISDLGALAIGSRLKRLSDVLMRGGESIYVYYGIDFEAKLFPLFYYLSLKNEAGIMEIAEALHVSHPAVIQTAKELEKKGLISSKKSSVDARKRNLKITQKGKELLPKLQKIWADITEVNQHIISQQQHDILAAVQEIENVWAEKKYLDRFKEFHKLTE